MKFYLGTHVLNHLEKTDKPLFVSRRVFEKRKSSLDAQGEWCLDSGGFSELSLYGKWTINEQQYIEHLIIHHPRFKTNVFAFNNLPDSTSGNNVS